MEGWTILDCWHQKNTIHDCGGQDLAGHTKHSKCHKIETQTWKDSLDSQILKGT